MFEICIAIIHTLGEESWVGGLLGLAEVVVELMRGIVFLGRVEVVQGGLRGGDRVLVLTISVVRQSIVFGGASV